jgi:hypothetical protein
MTGIIARLESAQEGSRELDEAIYDAIGRPGDDDPQEYSFLHGDCPPAYSTSLDAALALVPEGYMAISASLNERGPSSVRIGHPYVFGNAATPALALTIASLRAREKG